ncbi:hypothetical protein JCM10212_000212 [Sporobolomyces blumeae]
MPNSLASHHKALDAALAELAKTCLKREERIAPWREAILASLSRPGVKLVEIMDRLDEVHARVERGEFIVLDPLDDKSWITHEVLNDMVREGTAHEPTVHDAVGHLEGLLKRIATLYRRYHSSPADKRDADTWESGMLSAPLFRRDHEQGVTRERLTAWREQLTIIAERARNHQRFYSGLAPDNTIAHGRHLEPLDNSRPDSVDFFPVHYDNESEDETRSPLDHDNWVTHEILNDMVREPTVQQALVHLEEFIKWIAQRYRAHHSSIADERDATKWRDEMLAASFFRQGHHVPQKDLVAWREQLIIVSERVRNHQRFYPGLAPEKTIANGHHLEPLRNEPPDNVNFFDTAEELYHRRSSVS